MGVTNWKERALAAEAELKAALEQEPIKYLYRVIDCFGHDVLRDDPKGATILETIPLYAAPITAPAPAVNEGGWERFTDDDLAEIHQLAYELGGTDSGEYLLDGDQLDQVVVKCASLFYVFPVQSAPAPAVPKEWRDVMAGLVAIAEKKGKKQGSPNHCHQRPGIWDDDNGPVLSGKPCAECAMYDKARALLQSGGGK